MPYQEKNVIIGVGFSCDRWDVGVNISAGASAFMYARCRRSVLLTCILSLPLSVCSIIPPSLFNYAVDLCAGVQITQGGRANVVLCGCLRRWERKDGAGEAIAAIHLL